MRILRYEIEKGLKGPYPCPQTMLAVCETWKLLGRERKTDITKIRIRWGRW